MNDLVGKKAVPFELTDSQGQSHKLRDDDGHWLLLIFHRHLG